MLFLVGCARIGFDGDRGQDLALDGPGTADISTPERPAMVDGLPLDQPGITDGPITEGPAADGPGAPTGTIVPLYVDPPHNMWTALAQHKQAHPKLPVVAVVNVVDGPTKSSKPEYETGIAALSLSGVTVIGYVNTNYGNRDIGLVKQDIDRWNSFYSAHGLKGIFLDRQATAAAELSFYQDATQHAKGKGLSPVVGDPGVDPDPSYVGVMDTMVIYQGKGLPPISSLGGWHTQHPRESFAVLAYDVPQLDKSFVASARKNVGYLYITDDGAGTQDPWDSLSSTFDALLVELEK